MTTAVPNFILQFSRAPGDVLMLTGLVRDLKRLQGDASIAVRTEFPDLWKNNPYLSVVADDDLTTTIKLGGKGARRSDKDADRVVMRLSCRSMSSEKFHYARGFHYVFEQRTGLHVPCTESKPDLHLTDEEKNNQDIPGRYWVIVPGGKTDATCKWWYDHRYQQVVDMLRPHGLRFVQEGATKKSCSHNPLRHVTNVIGQTTIRDLICNIYHAEGVICGCSLPMHIAGALDKPCVVLLGGREEPWFEAYVNDYAAFGPVAAPVKVPHKVLHTIGLLSCCQTVGCWKQRVVPLLDGQRHDASLCERPSHAVPLQPLAECMTMITADHVAEAVMSYYEEGYLPPLA